MLRYRYEKLVTWPGGARTHGSQQKEGAFKMTWGKILNMLEREIYQLRGTDVVFKAEVRSDRDINRDGTIRSDARFVGSAVIVEFNAGSLEGSPRLTYACDTYQRFDHNVRAVAGILESLRTVERYGGKTGGRQYQGFKALPSSSESSMTPVIAAKLVADAAGLLDAGILTNPDVAKEAVRRAIHRTHPDRTGGERAAYDRVDRARSVLSSHHGVAL